MNKDNKTQAYLLAGSFTLALRLVVGWTYFSAFWRRLIIENKLDPEGAGYIGEKFNNFLPNALGIKPLIEYLVSNPDLLWLSMWAFTLIEAIVGLFIMIGLFTRLMSVGVLLLATGILLGSGWIGTTCLDEWQIGILGMATGFALLFTGGGQYSLDNKWLGNTPIGKHKLFPWVGSGVLPLKDKLMHRIILGGTVVIFSLTLFTNQHFHGGIWGTLHNKSVSPIVEISDATLTSNALNFTVYRVEGADVYGSFLIGVTLQDAQGNAVLSYDGEMLAKFPAEKITNKYVAKVKPGKHSLIIPLGAKAELTIQASELKELAKGTYQLILTDISGKTWEESVNL